MSLNSGETLQPFKALNQLIFDSSGNLIGIQNDRAVGNDLRIGGGSGVDGTFATLVATTALKLNSGAVFDLYNTADQTTNYERLRAQWTGNVTEIFTQAAGSGANRNIRIGAGSGTNFALGLEIVAAGASTSRFIFTGTDASASGTHTFAGFNPTINQSGTAGYIALDINPTETATGSGTKLLQRWAVGGAAVGQMTNGGVFGASSGVLVGNSGGLGFASALTSATQDVYIGRDAADVLALRRATNAQTVRAYNTYTDASNGEWGFVRWAANEFLVGNSYNGTGVVRPMSFQIANVTRWTITTSGNWVAGVDNTYDIGASGATRPRTIYVGNGVISPLLRATVQTVAGLLAAATAGSGARCTVSDSTVAMAGNYGAIVAGGGANIVPVFSDGTNWLIG